MDKLVRKIEVPIARNIIKKSGLYLIEKKDIDALAEVAKEENYISESDLTKVLKFQKNPSDASWME